MIQLRDMLPFDTHTVNLKVRPIQISRWAVHAQL